jgi:hypothetical protein
MDDGTLDVEREAAADIIGEMGSHNPPFMEDHEHLENAVQTLLFLTQDASTRLSESRVTKRDNKAYSPSVDGAEICDILN